MNTEQLVQAAEKLTKDDRLWLKSRVDLAIAEYLPVFVQECPGKAMKDRFYALLSALEAKP
jgi:hypothetical protein